MTGLCVWVGGCASGGLGGGGAVAGGDIVERGAGGRAGGSTAEMVLEREGWSFGGADGSVVRTPHYRLFTTVRNPVLVDRVALFLERGLEHYRRAALSEGTAALPAPPERLDTYLMSGRAEWESVTRRLLGDRSDEALGIGRGGFAARGVGVYWNIGLYDTLAVAAHEGWHQYTQRTFRQGLPVYLEEGIASYMEGHKWENGVPEFSPWANLERYDRLRAAVGEGTLLSMEELLTVVPSELVAGRNERVLTYYAQVWALAHFLKSGGDGVYRSGLERMVRDAAAGRLVNGLMERGASFRDAVEVVRGRRGPALLEAYVLRDAGMSMAAFEARYAAFVERLSAVGVRDLVVSGVSPIGG